MRLVLSLPALLVLVTLLTACAGAAATVTEETRCRQSGGIWRTATNHCEQSAGGGGY